MCLAVPARIVERFGDADAVAELHGSRLTVNVSMTPTVSVGNWVLLHAGFSLEILDEALAAETWDVLTRSGAVATPAEVNHRKAAAP